MRSFRRSLSVLLATGAVVALPVAAWAYPPTDVDEGTEVLGETIERDREGAGAPADDVEGEQVAGESIPNAGADSAALAGLGFGALVIGGGAVAYTRRRNSAEA